MQTADSSSNLPATPAHVANLISEWFDPTRRELPWRNTGDPYVVWIAEVMLQQTSVTFAATRFLRWMDRFPTVVALAEADERDVLSAWEGLGYYSRARNLQLAARQIVERFDGSLPDSYKELISLPGIGDYTANAILAIAFNQPAPAIDVNLRRILTRVIGASALPPQTEKVLRAFLVTALQESNPCRLTEALMELGQTICRRKNPRCALCPLVTNCATFIQYGTIPIENRLEAKIDKRTEVAVVVLYDSKILLCESTERLFEGMYLLPKITFIGSLEQSIDIWCKNWKQNIIKIIPLTKVMHTFTSNRVTMLPVILELNEPFSEPLDKARWIATRELNRLPMPTAHRKILNQIKCIAQNFK